MKKIWNFLVWKYKQYDSWQKLWWLGCFFMGGYIGADKDSLHSTVWLYMAMVSFAVTFFKWFVYDMIRESWNDYQDEQKKIIDILSKEHK